MTAYSSYDGVPLVANEQMLTDILRNEWGYKYFTMSDAGGTDRLGYAFKMCKYIDRFVINKVRRQSR